MWKENEVFGQVEYNTEAEREDEDKEESDFGSWLGAHGFLVEPEGWKGSHEKNRCLGTDGTEGVGQSFVSQKFRHQHSKERSEEEGVGHQT